MPVGGGGAWPGFKPTRRAAEQRPGPTGVEGAGGAGGPGCGAGGWRQGQGGPRDRPLRAEGSRVAISWAGRRPPAHTAARPNEAGHAAWTARGRAAAHGHIKRPGLTRQKIRQPEVWQLVRRLNSAQDAQQLEPHQINEKRPRKRHRSQLHSNTPKSHMRNMRAS